MRSTRRMPSRVVAAAMLVVMCGCAMVDPTAEPVAAYIENHTESDLSLEFRTREPRDRETVRLVLPPGGRFQHRPWIISPANPEHRPVVMIRPSTDVCADPLVSIILSRDAWKYELVTEGGVVVARRVEMEQLPW